jgi:hypothetical protein
VVWTARNEKKIPTNLITLKRTHHNRQFRQPSKDACWKFCALGSTDNTLVHPVITSCLLFRIIFKCPPGNAMIEVILIFGQICCCEFLQADFEIMTTWT